MKKNVFFIVIIFYSFDTISQKRDKIDFLKLQFSIDNKSINYRLLKPYYETTDNVPLVIFLHGSGERGNDNEMQLIHGANFFLKETEKKEFNSYVILPQCPKNNRWSSHKVDPWVFGHHHKTKDVSHYGSLVIKLIESLIKNNNIDSDRIYISGLSMGGYGTFDLVSYRPDLFAAAAPICGGADLDLLKNALDVPFWIFHGDADSVVPVEYSQNAFKLLVSKNNKHRYTEYKDVNHNSWDYVFKEEDYFKWMFSKSK